MTNPTQIILAGADASGNNQGILPAAPGITGWWYLGTNSAQSKKNLVTPAMGGAGDLTVVGTEPTYNAGYVTTAVNGASGYQSPIFDSNNMTVMVVARSPALIGSSTSTFGYLAGSQTSAGSGGKGFALYDLGNNAGAFPWLSVSQNGAAAVSERLSGDSTVTWKFMAATMSGLGAANGAYNIYDLTSNVQQLGTAAAATLLNTTTAIQIGVAPLSDSPQSIFNTVDMAAAIIAPATVLTLAQIQAVYAQVKVRMTALGISI